MNLKSQNTNKTVRFNLRKSIILRKKNIGEIIEFRLMQPQKSIFWHFFEVSFEKIFMMFIMNKKFFLSKKNIEEIHSRC